MNYDTLKALLMQADEHNSTGNFDEAEILLGQVLDHVPFVIADEDRIKLKEVRMDAHCMLGTIALQHGKHTVALEFYTAAKDESEAIGHKAGIAQSMNGLGNVYTSLSNYPLALEYYTKAIFILEELGNKAAIAPIINKIGNVYWQRSDYPLALEYYSKALIIHEELGQKAGSALVTSNIGMVYDILGDYPLALEYYAKALATHEEMGDITRAASVYANIGNVYSSLSDCTLAIEYYTKAIIIQEEIGEKANAAGVTMNIGVVYKSLSDYPRTLEYYGKALTAFVELKNKTGVALVTGNIGNVYLNLSDYPRALEYYSQALAVHEELGQKLAIARVIKNIGAVYADKNFEGYDAEKAKENLMKALAISEEIGAKQILSEIEKSLATLYDTEKQWEEFAIHFKKFYELEKEVQSEEAKKSAALMEQRKQIAEREKEIAIARAATNAKHEATEQLLHNVLPPSIADKMLGGAKIIAEKLNNVSVLFADIVEFTKLSQRITPEELVDGLDRIFSTFDMLAEKHGLEKIKTIGDAYMVVSGAPEARINHAEAIANFAIESIEAMKQFRSISTGEEIQLRIGIHSGEVVAGVIGKKKFAYDMWGDAVNTASRMESHGEAGKIHVSEEFLRALSLSSSTSPMSLHFQERGEMEIKGKGMMKTYFLESKP